MQARRGAKRDSDRERLESLSQPVGVWLTNGLPRTPMYLPEQSKGLIMSDPSVSEPSKPGSSKKPISPARKIIGAVALVALVGVAWLEDQRCSGTIPPCRRFRHDRRTSPRIS